MKEEKNHANISMNAKKKNAPHKTQYSYMIKTIIKLGTEGHFHKMVKGLHKKNPQLTSNSINKH